MESTILLIVIPLLLGFLSMIFKNGKNTFLYLGIAINVALLFVIKQGEYTIGGFDAPFGINLVLDQLSYIGVILVNTLFFLAVVSNMKQVGKFSTVILTLLAGVNGMLLTGDLFNLFVFLEITSISAYILTTSSKKYTNTFTYLIIGSVGSGIYLLGVIMLYAGYGSLNLADLATKVQASNLNVILPLLLIFVGLSVEAKLVPFNGWVKGIYKNANGLVGSLMAAVVASVTMIVMGRILNSLFIGSEFVNYIILLVAVITLIAGEMSAFNGKTIKEILLFSSIGQSGLITILMVTGLVFPAMLVIVNNAVSKLVMFTIAGEFSPENEDYTNLKGIFNSNKLLGLGFTISSFSLIGLPLFLGFYAKFNSLVGLFEVNYLLPIVLLAVTIIEGAYLIKLNIALWHPGNEGEAVYTTEPTESKGNTIMVATVVLLSIVILSIGLKPELLGDNVKSLNNSNIEYLTDMKGGM